MYIYAFGSLCRGEIDNYSDADILLITDSSHENFNHNLFTIYSLDKIKDLWNIGNAFAWHLWLESVFIFSYTGTSVIDLLGKPQNYSHVKKDCLNFYNIFLQASNSLSETDSSSTFDLSSIFLSIRNFATCFSLGHSPKPTFSRRSPLELGRKSLNLKGNTFKILERARLLSTRGVGTPILDDEIILVVEEINLIKEWMEKLLFNEVINE